MREDSEAVNESFWDAPGVEIEAKQVLGSLGGDMMAVELRWPMFEAFFIKL